MLILTRKVGTSFIIDEHIEVTVLEIKANQVRLGIKAPKEVKVNREEVYLKEKEDRQELDYKSSKEVIVDDL